MKYCTNCQQALEDGSRFCPNCGQEQKKPESSKKKWWLILAVIVVVLIVGIVAVVCVRKMKHSTDLETAGKNQEVTSSTGEEKTEKEDEVWTLFQENKSSYALSEEEKQWALSCVKRYVEYAYEAEYFGHSMSYEICSKASWKDGTVTVCAALTLKDALFPQYTKSVQYLQMTFPNEKEPALTEINFGVGEEESSRMKAKASSVCASQHDQNSQWQELCEYGAENVLDMNPNTAWIEGKNSYGTGESITISTSKEKQIYGIALQNGYIKSARTLERNAQVKDITVQFSDGSKQTYELKKNVYETGVTDWYSDCLIFEEPVRTNMVKITINSVYPSKAYYEKWDGKNADGAPCKDTCISEIKVLECPKNFVAETLPETVVEKKVEKYKNWQDAYEAVVGNLEHTMQTYENAMEQYVDAYGVYHGNAEDRYDEDGDLYLPNGGFLADLNQDEIPELCLVSARELDEESLVGNYAESIIHVFTFDVGQVVYCGSTVTRFPDAGEMDSSYALYFEMEQTTLFQNLDTGELCTLQCNAGEDAGGQIYHNYFTIKGNRLVRSRCAKTEYFPEDKSSGMVIVSNCNINFSSVKASEYQRYLEKGGNYNEVIIGTLFDLEQKISQCK